MSNINEELERNSMSNINEELERNSMSNINEELENINKSILEIKHYINMQARNSADNNSEIQALKNEVARLNNRVNMLEAGLKENVSQPQKEQLTYANDLHDKEPIPNVKSVANNKPIPNVKSVANNKSMPNAQYKPMYDRAANSMAPKNQAKPVMNRPQAKRNKASLEDSLGKQAFPIIAAVLIFISFVLLIGYISPLLTDVEKVFGMTFISFIFIFAGIFGLKISKKEIFSIIMSVGVGGIYITIVASGIIFNLIDSTILMLLLLFWVCAIAIMSYFIKKIPYIIGQVGIAIAILIGTVHINYEYPVKTDGLVDLILLIIFLAFANVVMILAKSSKEYKASIPTHCQFLLSIALMFVLCNLKLTNTVPTIILVALLIGYIIFVNLYYINKEHPLYYISNGGCAAVIIFYVSEQFSGAYNITAIFIVTLLLEVLIKAVRRKTENDNFVIDAMMLGIFVVFNLGLYRNMVMDLFDIPIQFIAQNHNAYSTIAKVTLFLYVIYKLYLAYVNKDKKYSVLPIIANFIFLLPIMRIDSIIIVACELVFIICLGCILYKKYYLYAKMGLYLTVIATSLYVIDMLRKYLDSQYGTPGEEISYVIGIIFIMGLNLIMIFTKLKNNWNTNAVENETNKLLLIINSALLILSLVFIGNKITGKNVLIIIAIILASIYSKPMIEKSKKNVLYAILLGAKYITVATVVLSSFDGPEYLVSIIWFIIAVAGVLVGFVFAAKNIRIVSLIIAMTSVAKLMLLDIQYTNSLEKILAFFIGGLIVLGISTIYFIVDKKIK